jgi:hypothetical protein
VTECVWLDLDTMNAGKALPAQRFPRAVADKPAEADADFAACNTLASSTFADPKLRCEAARVGHETKPTLLLVKSPCVLTSINSTAPPPRGSG